MYTSFIISIIVVIIIINAGKRGTTIMGNTCMSDIILILIPILIAFSRTITVPTITSMFSVRARVTFTKLSASIHIGLDPAALVRPAITKALVSKELNGPLIFENFEFGNRFFSLNSKEIVIRYI